LETQLEKERERNRRMSNELELQAKRNRKFSAELEYKNNELHDLKLRLSQIVAETKTIRSSNNNMEKYLTDKIKEKDARIRKQEELIDKLTASNIQLPQTTPAQVIADVFVHHLELMSDEMYRFFIYLGKEFCKRKGVFNDIVDQPRPGEKPPLLLPVRVCTVVDVSQKKCIVVDGQNLCHVEG